MSRYIKYNQFDSNEVDTDALSKLQDDIDLVENQALVNENAIDAIDTRVTILEGASTSVDFLPGLFTATSGITITSTDTRLNLDTETISNSNYSLSTDTITVTEAGVYLINYAFTYISDGTSGSTYGAYITKMKINGVEYGASITSCWSREATPSNPIYIGSSNSFIVNISASDNLSFFVENVIGFSPDTEYIQDNSQVSIIKLQ